MPDSTTDDNGTARPEDGSWPENDGADVKPMSDEAAQRALDEGDRVKIDRKLDEFNVSTTESGSDQTAKPDPMHNR